MNYKKSKYFTTLNKTRIKYSLIKKKAQITVVFFHGFMSDMIGAKPSAIQKICKKLKLIKMNSIGFLRKTISSSIMCW